MASAIPTLNVAALLVEPLEQLNVPLGRSKVSRRCLRLQNHRQKIGKPDLASSPSGAPHAVDGAPIEANGGAAQGSH